MRAAGVRALTRTEDIAGLGLAELASTIRKTLGVLRELKAMLRRERPDLVILIDFAEFNMSLAGAAKRAGVPVLYYITPQVWAWRRGRVARIIKRTDRLAVVLPFEAETLRGRRPARHLRRPPAARPRRSRPGSRGHAQTSRAARPRSGCSRCSRAAGAARCATCCARWSKRRACSRPTMASPR